MGDVLALAGIGKRYAGVQALRDASLALRAGEVHALMGQNGAGKSTLIKVLTGAVASDAGEMRVDGVPARPRSTLEAQALGIGTVYQEVNLCPNLSVAENVFAGRYPMRGRGPLRRIDWREAEARSRELLAEVGLDIDVTRGLSSFPVAVQQLVAIARALGIAQKVLILDEPTSSLDEEEVERLFAVLRRLRDKGLAILFVTHFLDQVYAIADRITVLRNGEFVGEWATAELPPPALIRAMVGRDLQAAEAAATERASRAETADATPVLEARGLGKRGRLKPVDLVVERGQIVGLGGLLGSGRTELARLLFGLDRADSGTLRVDGAAASFAAPVEAIRRGLAMCPEERKVEGIVGQLSVRENIVLALQARQGVWRSLPKARQREIAERLVRALGIVTADLETPIALLSGGNQQKAVLARWLAVEPRLLILDEPTRGIDVAAKQEVMAEIAALAKGGMAVLFISSEIAEVVRVADRIDVLRDRRKVGELPAGSSEQAVYHLIAAEA